MPFAVPDFRSPNTGLYANLARLDLPYAEAVFDISYFRQNPDPFYVLAKELYPGNYAPTISHVFIALLAKKGLLRMLFTQNIDCLERQAGVPGELIVEAHGSFATQRCIECKKAFPDDAMREHVLRGQVPRCADKKCDGLVKPDIVFFGEALPESFYSNRHVPGQADMAFVMGTSLTVHPFAGLPDLVGEDCPRVLFNMERVGSLGTQADDVLVLGDCDAGVRALAEALGWADELEAEWRRVVGEKEAARQRRSAEDRQAELHDEVADLADKVGVGLKLDNEPSDGGEGAAGGKVEEGEGPAAAAAASAEPGSTVVATATAHAGDDDSHTTSKADGTSDRELMTSGPSPDAAAAQQAHTGGKVPSPSQEENSDERGPSGEKPAREAVGKPAL